MIKKIYGSSTWMTWINLIIRLSGIALLLPLVLNRFSSADITVWLLFTAISSMQLLADMGFSQTFSRAIAYGFSSNLNLNAKNTNEKLSKFNSIEATYISMIWVYRRLAIFSLILLLSIGSYSVAAPINSASQPLLAWISWFILVGGISFFVYGNSYSSFIIGANQINLLKKWEALVSLCSLLTQVIVLIFDGGLLELIIVWQAWQFVQVIVNKALVKKINSNNNIRIDNESHNLELIKAMWESAWRTALGVVMSLGVVQGMIVYIANVMTSQESSGIMIAYRLMQTLSLFSQAPFYTKIPLMNDLRYQNEILKLSDVASKAMFNSLMVFTIGSVIIGVTIHSFMEFISSEAEFPSSQFWGVLVLAYFFERYGGMHIQLYSTTNHIIWHIANGVTGALWVALMLLIYPLLDIMALPLSMLCAYLGFYSWYTSYKSHKSIKPTGFWLYEKKASLVPFLIVLVYVMCSIQFNY